MWFAPDLLKSTRSRSCWSCHRHVGGHAVPRGPTFLTPDSVPFMLMWTQLRGWVRPLNSQCPRTPPSSRTRSQGTCHCQWLWTKVLDFAPCSCPSASLRPSQISGAVGIAGLGLHQPEPQAQEDLSCQLHWVPSRESAWPCSKPGCISRLPGRTRYVLCPAGRGTCRTRPAHHDLAVPPWSAPCQDGWLSQGPLPAPVSHVPCRVAARRTVQHQAWPSSTLLAGPRATESCSLGLPGAGQQ